MSFKGQQNIFDFFKATAKTSSYGATPAYAHLYKIDGAIVMTYPYKNRSTVVVGDTYPAREKLAKIGTWDATLRCYVLPYESLSGFEAIAEPMPPHRNYGIWGQLWLDVARHIYPDPRVMEKYNLLCIRRAVYQAIIMSAVNAGDIDGDEVLFGKSLLYGRRDWYSWFSLASEDEIGYRSPKDAPQWQLIQHLINLPATGKFTDINNASELFILGSTE